MWRIVRSYSSKYLHPNVERNVYILSEEYKGPTPTRNSPRARVIYLYDVSHSSHTSGCYCTLPSTSWSKDYIHIQHTAFRGAVTYFLTRDTASPSCFPLYNVEMPNTQKNHRHPRLPGKNKDGEPCAVARDGRYGQACCPHAPPARKSSPYGYATTKTHHVLTIPSGKYKGRYHLMTCCQMCGDSMNAQAAADPVAFAKKYVSKVLPSGALVLKNPHTGKPAQVVYHMGRKASSTRRRRRR